MNLKHIAIVTLQVTFTSISYAQQSASDAAYQKAQDARSQASDLYGKDNPTKAEVEQGINILNKTIIYLDSPPIKELAQGNLYLNARKHDIYFDLVVANLLAHDNEGALNALEKMCDQGSYFFIESLEKDSLFVPIRPNPRFTAVINKLKSREALYTDKSLNTPYQIDLSDAEKVAGLSLLWSQAKYNFANFDHAVIDWDKAYLDYLPKVTQTKSTVEYYRLLQKFYAQLRDGHTNVYFPKELVSQVNSRPPIWTELIEGKVFITKVFSDSLKNIGIVPGLEIMEIDNMPVKDYAKQYVEPYQSSSTPQDLEVREFTYGLISGDRHTPINLKLRSAKGQVFNRSIARSGYHDIKPDEGMSFTVMNGIGYLVINNFEDSKYIQRFDSLFTQINTTKGLIIDIRNNGGGNSFIGDQILTRLINKPFQGLGYRIPKYISIPGKGVQWDEEAADGIQPNGKLYYAKPVILLVSARTFSAAEDFAATFDYIKRGKLIGQITGGSTGQPVTFNLPGGGSARVCGKHNFYPDGKEFVGVGIQPDIVVEKRVADMYHGRDAALLKAIDILSH